MLITPLFTGQGLGNMLHCYVTTRSLALDKGYDFGVAFPERFKGSSFMKLDFGIPVTGLEIPIEGQTPSKLPEGMTYYAEKAEYHATGADIRGYDEGVFNIKDNTCLHGLLQGEKYFERHKDEIREWLAVEPLEMPDDLCILAFRGGEYVEVKDFYLSVDYWLDAIENMEKINPNMKFKIVTDDVETANKMLPFIEATHEIGNDWRSIRFAKYIILSNSSFGWLPAWLNQDVKKVIAPLHWGRHNLGFWSLSQNQTKSFTYQNKNGQLNS